MSLLLSRYFVFQLVGFLILAFAALAYALDPWWAATLVVLIPPFLIGVHDLAQPFGTVKDVGAVG